MKLLLLLFCSLLPLQWTAAQDKTYVITAPKVLRLDAIETVVVQIFGYNEDTVFTVSLKTYPDMTRTLSTQSVLLSERNRYQNITTVRLYPSDYNKYVYLEASTSSFTKTQAIPVSKENGYLFIQTEKPLYTPEQSVNVRVYSLNQEMKPALRPVTVSFSDPQGEMVEIRTTTDVTGIVSLQKPFKIPLKPKFGVWKIEAGFTDHFSTKATAEFEVKEYVLPSISVLIQPETNYISSNTFNSFKLTVNANYVHGAPVSKARVFFRYGYLQGDQTVLLPKTLTMDQLINGILEVTINMERALQTGDGPKTLEEMDGKNLYMLVTVQEMTGGISQEAELHSVKFKKSPFTIRLIGTPPFIKPNLPYTIKAQVIDPLGQQLKGVAVTVRATYTNTDGGETKLKYDQQNSGSGHTAKDGTINFIYNIPGNAKSAIFTLETTDETLPSSNQARLQYEASSYHSINQRYLYIDWASYNKELTVGDNPYINVYFEYPGNIPLHTFSYQIISRGKVVKFDTLSRTGIGSFQVLNFRVTSDMVPSIRLLVYYIMTGEGISELVADSVWISVNDKCVNGLQTKLSVPKTEYSPKETLSLTVEARENALVALSAVDTALYNLRSARKDPINTVLQHIEKSDPGCGGGGGKNNADVFRLAGLTFITNANAKSIDSDDECKATVRAKRNIVLSSEILKKVMSYKEKKVCCYTGIQSIPTLESCYTRAQRIRELPTIPHHECKQIFEECCEYVRKQKLNRDEFTLARLETETLLGLTPKVRSYFPESWLWDTYPMQPSSKVRTFNNVLPDSLTIWDIRAVGMFSNGICVADPLKIAVTQKLSVDVPLPYSMFRGEQIELKGSVYNQEAKESWFCVTLTAPKGVCLSNGVPTGDGKTTKTPCNKATLRKNSVNKVTFILMALEAGLHSLEFTLLTPLGSETVIKTLRVVPEGVRMELIKGNTLDPEGIYGKVVRKVEFKLTNPEYIVPKSTVQRLLTVQGELIGEVLSVVNDPSGIYKLTNLQRGSSESEIMAILSIFYVYDFLEETNKWNLLGEDSEKSKQQLRSKLTEGITSLMSYMKKGEYGYSMWPDREASTWVTALVLKTLGQVNKHYRVKHESLCQSLFWLKSCQDNDGSFKERGNYKPTRLMGSGANVKEQKAYLTAFAIIGIKNAMSVPQCDLQEFGDMMRRAAEYLNNNIGSLQSLYVRAVTLYALALVNKDNLPTRKLYEALKSKASVKGGKPTTCFWQDNPPPFDPIAPNKVSAQAVETTAHMLLTVILYGENEYAVPIIRWLSQDQRYGGGFYSVQDTILTLEAITRYGKLVELSHLDMQIRAYYKDKEDLGVLILTESKPVADAVEIVQKDDVILSTGMSKGVSIANIKTVYYSSIRPDNNCHFDQTIEIYPAVHGSADAMQLLPRIVACAKYKPENERYTEAGHTIMEIHLPTGMQPLEEDLDQMQNALDSIISMYEIKGDQVTLQIDSVGSQSFVCVGFRVQEHFRTGLTSASEFKVYEYHDQDSMCSKLYYPSEERKFMRLCDGEECQCMTAQCSVIKPSLDLSLSDARSNAVCDARIKYAFKVKIQSTSGEGDFVNYISVIKDIFKKGTEDVKIGTEVMFVKKATCLDMNLEIGAQYLIMGVEGIQIQLYRSYKYKFPLDSQSWVELWPETCTENPCKDFVKSLYVLAENLMTIGC